MRLQVIALVLAGAVLALAMPAQACPFHDQASADSQSPQQTAEASPPQQQPQTATQ